MEEVRQGFKTLPMREKIAFLLQATFETAGEIAAEGVRLVASGLEALARKKSPPAGAKTPDPPNSASAQEHQIPIG